MTMTADDRAGSAMDSGAGPGIGSDVGSGAGSGAGATDPNGSWWARDAKGRLGLMPRMGEPGPHKWAFAAIWLFYLVGPIIGALQKDRSVGWKVLVLGLAAVFIAGYCLLCWSAFPQTGRMGVVIKTRLAVPLVLFLALLTTILGLGLDHDFVGCWVYVGAGVGFSLPLEGAIAMRSLALTAAAMSLSCLIVHASAADWLTLLFPTVFAGLGTIGIRRMAYLITELREAREQVARLAVNEERLRLARDLHDLTGHSLSMITLKAELAQRMIERAPGPDEAVPVPALAAALKEITEIEQVSRQTLADIREAVSGYRRPTLAVELASAAAALEAAGIKLDADGAVASESGSHDPEIEAVLAWCLREAVTNAIRHSGARRVRVRVEETADELVLTVRNDGVGLGRIADGVAGDADGVLASGSSGLPSGDGDCGVAGEALRSHAGFAPGEGDGGVDGHVLRSHGGVPSGEGDNGVAGDALRSHGGFAPGEGDGRVAGHVLRSHGGLPSGEGNGLRGLRERLDAVGGRISVGGPDGDFRLVAAVPVRWAA